MKGFIIYSKTEKDLTRQDDYSVMRMLEAAKQKNITLSVISPNQFEMIVTRNDTKSILINNEHVGLPDFVIPRLGSNTTYYSIPQFFSKNLLAIFRKFCSSISFIQIAYLIKLAHIKAN